MNIEALVKKQRTFYKENHTLSYTFRKEQLARLRQALKKHEQTLLEALKKDVGKSFEEGYLTEIGTTLAELTYMEKHLKKLMKPKRVKTSLKDFPARSFRTPHPYGVTLVMSPWNYPVYLTLAPLIGAIAAGNTCVIKPSNYSKHTSDAISALVEETFDQAYISVVKGGREENQTLLDQKFDYIFFTGGTVVGRIVMEKAAKHLTPISLELGGKSPCIVDETASLKVAARRIAFGKYLNTGQTCVAPDYLLIHESVKDSFLTYFKDAVKETFGEKPLTSNVLGKIINQKHFDRLSDLLKDQTITLGGKTSPKTLKIEPTVLEEITLDNKIMQEEIFGPILPVITYKDINEVIHLINDRPHPLALYLFTNKQQTEDQILRECTFGGGCINDTVMHVASETLPFGGVGDSGMGNYHGKHSFETFSHTRSILKKANWLDLPIRYAPYTKKKMNLIKKFLK